MLRVADRTKDDFIALLAHELRNPLAPLRNGLQILRLPQCDSQTASRAREMMDRQLIHMVRLVDDLLDVSRISRNKMELRLARVSVSEIVSHAVETARPMIEESLHELTITLPPGPLYLNADLTRLSQVFSNLLTNSAKYTPVGGKIGITAERCDDRVVVAVQDSGIGIPPAAINDIFNMFSQVDRTIERTSGGLGIGLALVKGLVEMHGGTVIATSEGDGLGSLFTVALPLAEQINPMTAPQIGSGFSDDRRILVVDDSRDGAESLAMLLKMLGNEVEIAHNGLDAIAIAEQFQPDVILMDIGMPQLNGLDATRKIREQEWGRSPTIIALTGWGQDADRERSQNAGCDGHLTKPVSLDDLAAILNRFSGE